jgi:hypothetical protein
MKAGFSFGVFFLLIFAGASASAQTRPAHPAPETQAAVSAPTTSSNASIPRTSLEMKVVGVLAIGEGDDRRSSAIIGMKGSKTSMTYSPGQVIDGNADLRLVKVRNERIEFLNQGKMEFAPVRQFPEAGWGGNAPVASSPPPAAAATGAGGDAATDRLQALKDARKERLQQRAKPDEKPAE